MLFTVPSTEDFKEFIISKKLPNSVLEIRVNEDKKDTTIKKIQILCVFFKDGE
jgi:hypothetical protein